MIVVFVVFLWVISPEIARRLEMWWDMWSDMNESEVRSMIKYKGVVLNSIQVMHSIQELSYVALRQH